MTIRQRKGHLDHLTVGFCGDLKFGRTVHSLVNSLVRHPENEFYFISPEELKIPDYVIEETLKPNHSFYKEVTSLEETLFICESAAKDGELPFEAHCEGEVSEKGLIIIHFT